MVATRSRGKATGDAAATNNTTASTLKAPPKRAVKRKAADEVPAPEPGKASAQQPAKRKRTAAAAATAELEKPATRTTRRAAKPVEEPQAEASEAPKPAKRATRGRKAAEPAVPVVEPEKKIEEPAPTKTTRARKAPGKVTKAVATKAVRLPPASSAPKRATRATKATVSIAAPIVGARATDSPLKKPARKPAKKTPTRKTATKAVVENKAAVAPVEEPFAEFPTYPSTPGHIVAPISGRDALKELPAGYPETPAHIAAPISSRDALKELPAGYPSTPAHISAPTSSGDAFKELPIGYPNTPAHIIAPAQQDNGMLEQSEQQSAAQQDNSSKPFPTSFSVPDSSDDEDEDEDEDIAEPLAVNVPSSHTATPSKIASSPKTPKAKTPVQSEEALQAMLNQEALEELPADYPRTPAQFIDAYGNKEAFNQLPEYPKTPAHVAEAYGNQKALDELPGYPKTPNHIMSAQKNQKAFKELAAEYPSTPDEYVDASENLQAFKQMAEYPKTPAHINAPMSTREALKELPIDYPATPAHIMTVKQGLDQLPGYPNTPALKNVTSTPAQQSSASKSASDNGSEEFESALDVTESDLMQIDGDDYIVKSTPPKVNFNINGSISLAPTLAPPVSAARASPTKSALRSPLKNGAKTPKKQVTWPEDFEADEDETFDFSVILRGTRFLVDVTSNGEDQSLFFTTTLEEMGAQVFREWTETTSLTHVIFKEGSQETIDKIRASNGTVKCINTGWLVDVENTKKRVNENKYLIDLSTATVCTPVARTPRRRDFFTPAKTPTRFLNNIESSSAAKSVEDIPATPTSSDFDRSLASIEDKENSFEDSTFFKKFSLSVPAKKPWRMAKAPTKTPTKESLLREAPVKSSIFSERPVKSSMISERPVKSSMFSQPPVKNPFFGSTAAKDPLFSQPPIKGPLFRTGPMKSSSLFGQSPSKPSSLDRPASPDTWFDQQAKKSSSLLGQGPVKSSTLLSQSVQKPVTSGRFSALLNGVPSTPTANRVAPPVNFLSTHKKRTAAQSFGGSITTPAKKFRGLF
ncbi:uncharacterized protein N0V89_003243 [Didymosphaeria variabile]|uniref:BRCT domain-containing protein n=1 Tax=Didymosphaeria variabile TaxID=1932322 RepID=A0A9W9CFA7_9PLEO|nr:uncharacterized protein N0V89_003243 [Didymosphaeria variabile]KAJ4358659.1 hypothetical protein N0V89_003243 [Didymosphaeria variabile]